MSRSGRPGAASSMTRGNWIGYLWWVIAAVLFLVVYDEAHPLTPRWVIWVAAWLAPMFLLRFTRTQRLLPGILLAWLMRFGVAAVVLRGILLYSGVRYYLTVLLLTAVTTLPYLADRLVIPRLRGFVSSLVFPAAFTSLEYLASFGPLGTYNSIAYTQKGDLPLLQLVSVTGIWGITFLISWFAAVVNWAWEHRFAWHTVRHGALLFAAVLSVVLLGGGGRLLLSPPASATVRIAGIIPSRAAVAAVTSQLPPATVNLLLTGKATQVDRASARKAFTVVDDDLFALSQQEARAGAKIVAWAETSPSGASVLQEDQSALIQQAAGLARQEGIYLDMGLAVFGPEAGRPPFLQDEAVLIDPAGNVVWTYEKSHPAPGDQGLITLGNGKIPVVDTPYGRLANAICFDLDFPATIREAGQAGADLLLGPSDDWLAIDPSHSQRATYRAIENGISLVRETSNGPSIMVDQRGRVLAASDSYRTDQPVMANVPTHRSRTIYSTIGDLFAWLCLTGLVALIGTAAVQPRNRRGAAAAAADPAAQVR
jgi:apolipoprotein N-acyltransferase